MLSPNRLLTFSNLKFLIQLISSTALYNALSPSLRAACPARPSATQSITIKPRSATAISNFVGSPTMPQSISPK